MRSRIRTGLVTTFAVGALALGALVAPGATAATIIPDDGVKTLGLIQAERTVTAAHPVRAARAATRGLRTPSKAIDAGFTLLRDKAGLACIAMPGMGGMGVHYVNGPRVDSQIRLRQPEALVYRFADGGRLRLAALEYVVLKQDWDAAHGTDAARPRLYGHRFDFTPAGNRFGLPDYYSLHAWVWKHNPAGRFAMFNPQVHCPGI